MIFFSLTTKGFLALSVLAVNLQGFARAFIEEVIKSEPKTLAQLSVGNI